MKTQTNNASYFKTPNLDTIAQIVGLQLKINEAYITLQLVANEVADLVCDGERITLKTVNEKGIVTPYSLMLYVKNYEIWYNRKPAWAPEIMTAARTFETLVKRYKNTNTMKNEKTIEAISEEINAQIALLKELTKARNAMLDALYSSQFSDKIEVLEYFELFEIQHERKVTVYFNDMRLLTELKFNKSDGYYTQSGLHYIVKAYNAKMIAHTDFVTMQNI